MKRLADMAEILDASDVLAHGTSARPVLPVTSTNEISDNDTSTALEDHEHQS